MAKLWIMANLCIMANIWIVANYTFLMWLRAPALLTCFSRIDLFHLYFLWALVSVLRPLVHCFSELSEEIGLTFWALIGVVYDACIKGCFGELY